MHTFTKQQAVSDTVFCHAGTPRAPGYYRRASMNAALAVAATLVAVGFALSTLDRWLRRRRPHDLAWSVSLALFAAGAGALWWAETAGWSLASFRLFYLAGAVLNVPWLALGTVYLLAGRRIGDRVRWWLVLFSGFSAGVVLFAPTRGRVGGHGAADRQRRFRRRASGAGRRRLGHRGDRDHRRRAVERVPPRAPARACGVGCAS